MDAFVPMTGTNRKKVLMEKKSSYTTCFARLFNNYNDGRTLLTSELNVQVSDTTAA